MKLWYSCKSTARVQQLSKSCLWQVMSSEIKNRFPVHAILHIIFVRYSDPDLDLNLIFVVSFALNLSGPSHCNRWVHCERHLQVTDLQTRLSCYLKVLYIRANTAQPDKIVVCLKYTVGRKPDGRRCPGITQNLFQASSHQEEKCKE